MNKLGRVTRKITTANFECEVGFFAKTKSYIEMYSKLRYFIYGHHDTGHGTEGQLANLILARL